MIRTGTPSAPGLASGSDTGISSFDDDTSDTTPTITGLAGPGARVVLYDGATAIGSATADASTGEYAITVAAPFDDGAHDLTVVATAPGASGSSPSPALIVTIDTTAPSAPPAPTLSAGSDTGVSYTDDLTKDTTPTITGTAEPGATVQLLDNDGTVVATGTAGASGSYVLTSRPLAPGAHALTVTATDAAGNVSYPSAPLNIVIDTTPATATTTLATGEDQDPDTTTVSFSVHFDQPVSPVTLKSFRITDTGTATATIQSVTGSGTDYTVTLDGLSGTGTIGLTGTSVTDLAGNPVTVTSHQAYSVDSTRPPNTYLVTSSATGAAGTGALPSLSNSGGLVAFNSITGALVPSGAADGTDNVFVKSVATGAIILVSVGTDGDANGDSYAASIAGNGQEIAFASDATNLVAGGTPAGQTNIYVAALTTAASGGSLGLVPGSIQLVSPGGSTPDVGPVLSVDGTTVAFDSSAALVPGAETGVENVYVEDLATGTITLVSGGTGQNEYGYEDAVDSSGISYKKLTPVANKAPGTGGDFDSAVTSISADGTLIAYESDATDLGGAPIDAGSNYPVERGYVYNVTTGVTTPIDGTSLLDPAPDDLDSIDYQTYDPVLSDDGTAVYFAVHTVIGETQVQYLFKEDLATGTVVPISEGDADTAADYDYSPSDSSGGTYVLYESNPGYFSDAPQYEVKLLNTALSGLGTSDLGQAYVAVIDPLGNAYAVQVEPNGAASDEIYETIFEITASIDPIGSNDDLDATEDAAAIAAGGLTVTGTTNAPAGSTVLVHVFFGTTVFPTIAGTADGSGHWSATLPVFDLQGGPGRYVLALQIQAPGGGSDQEYRVFTISTRLPATPAAPVVMPAPAAANGIQNGVVYSNSDTPLVTGTSSVPFGTVALYDLDAADPATPIATGNLDKNGNYALTPGDALADGLHHLEVQLTDVYGNSSAVSAPLAVMIDTVAPDALGAPTVVGGVRTDIADPVKGSSGTFGITDYSTSATVTLTGTAEPDALVDIFDPVTGVTVGEGTASADGVYTIVTRPLADGGYELAAIATDAAGNIGTYTNYIVLDVDTQAPAAPVLNPVTGQMGSGDTFSSVVDATGTAEPYSKISLQVDGIADTTDPAVTAGTDGSFDLRTLALPGGTHTLTVTATDAAGNVSAASAPDTVTISATPLGPPDTPPSTPTDTGTLTDGYIAGATVFADANGNGVFDTGEAETATDTNGQFTLFGGNGELIATGGIDRATGLAAVVALVAPAGSEDIDPLTTLLAFYQQNTGDSLAAAQAAVTAALGLAGGGGTDLTRLDPVAAAVNGSATLDPAVADGAPLIASAKIMDTAIDFANLLAGDVLAGSHPGAAAIDAQIKGYFASVIGAMAKIVQETGTLDLDDQATLNTILTETASQLGITAAFAAQVANQPTAVAIVAAENGNLDVLAAGATLPTAVAQVEYVAQGAVAAALEALANDTPATVANLQTQYTGQPLYTATSASLALLDGAPQLSPVSDTGESDQDNTTTDVTPTFIGTAKPGTYVTIFEDKLSYPLGGFYPISSSVAIGTGIADATGHYSIAVTSLTADTLTSFPTVVGAVASAADPDVTAGDIITVPTDAPTLTVFFDDPNPGAPFIEAATPAAATGDDTADSALLVYGKAAQDTDTDANLYGVIQVYADGGTTPIGTGLLNADFAFAITTTPLSIGPHTLTVTETLSGGTVLTGSPYSVTVGAAAFVEGTASATGAIADATVYEYDKSPDQSTAETINLTQDAVSSVTTATGAYADTYDPVNKSALLLRGGYETVTGVPLGGYVAQTVNLLDNFPATLMAPYDFAAVTPLSTLLDLADADDLAAGGATPADNDGNEAAVLSAFGLPTDLDLATLNPLASAQAGDTAPLLVMAKLLDTVTILSGLVGFSFVPIADYLGNDATIDLDSASDIAAAYGAFIADSPAYNQSYENGAALLADLPAVAAIVAASNQAIDSHAATATSIADLLSYTLAAETVAQETETAAVAAGVAADPGDGSSLAALTPAYTGAALDAAIEAARRQATQATNFVAAGPATTAAPSVTFTITFSQAVTGLLAADFAIVAGGDLTGAAVTAVTAVAGSGGTDYDVAVSTGIGQGTLALTFTGTGLTSVVGKPITDGLFAPAVTTLSPTGVIGDAIAVGDFNGDGRPDAVLSGGGQYGLTLFLNNGNGSFTAQAPITGALYGYDIVVGDFNGDGKLDVAEIGSADTSGDSTLAILLGNGDGTFQPAIDTQVAPGDLAVGDFNGDGHPDLAITDFNTDTVSILLGNGDGTFTAGQSFTTASPTAEIETADLTGNGKLDLVMANTGAGTVSIFLGNGDGTFTAAPNETIQVGSDPQGIAIGDLNGDGIPDIVVANAGSDSVSVLLGKSDGTFTALARFVLSQAGIDTSFLAHFQPGSIAIADVNNDGKPDLVLTSPNLGTAVLDGNGDGTFTLGDQTSDGPTGSDVGAGLAVADVNGDGRMDILEPGDVAQPGIAEGTRGLNVLQNEAPPVLGSTSTAVTIDRAAVAQPTITELSGGGTLTKDGDTYTLDLGTLTQGQAEADAVFAILNAATGTADALHGLFGTPTGSGFTITGDDLPALLSAGQSYGGLTFAVDTSTPGSHSEQIVFAPQDLTDDPGTQATQALTDGDSVTLPVQQDTSGDDVAKELPALTLVVDDNVAAGTTGPAVLGVDAGVVLPNVRQGASDTQAVTITNTAAAPAAALDVTATASGSATVSGSITGLAPQATDDSSLRVGIDTGAAGVQSGTVVLAPVSEPDTALATDDVAVSGTVYRDATAAIAPVDITVHVGDAGSADLQITNTDTPDGFSEALIASITGVTAGLSIAAGGPTADIAAGATDRSSLAVGFSTAAAGIVTGAATLALASDGGTGTGSVDGLGQAALPSATVPITVTVDSYAQAGFAANGGTLTAGPAPDTWVLNLGTATQGAAALAGGLSVLNTAQGPADLLGGSYVVSGGGGFTNTGFAAFSGIGADGSADAGSIALSTGSSGTFSETIVLTPTDTEGAGMPTIQAPQTVTVIGTVAPPTGTAVGDVHLMTFDGLNYNFQAVGDFTLAQSNAAGDSFRVQISTTPFANIAGTSIITEAAAQVGGNVVTFGMGGKTVAINGVADTSLSLADPTQLLAGGTLRMIAANEYELIWATGETVTVTKGAQYLNVAAKLGSQDTPGSVQGLLGSDTGQANDFALPDGNVLKQPLSTATLLGTFADAWTVALGQSLLGGTVPAASGLGTSPAMTFLEATAPGQILTGSLQAGGQVGAPVTVVGALADLSGDTIANFAAQDLIDVTNAGSTLATLAYPGTAAGGVLTISAGPASASLHLSSGMSGSVFHVVSDQHGGTLIGYV